MASAERLPDQALVVRCGRPPFEDPIPLCERCVHHEGVFGFSVQCADEVPLDRLAGWCPNKKVGVATVGEIRAYGVRCGSDHRQRLSRDRCRPD